jgi:UDP-2,4-diacetamido-2,4,6-trideoxy-beta-L-altropyranose hydrolase
MRCLTLAAALRTRGAAVRFVCAPLPGNLCSAIEAQGFEVLLLPPSHMVSSVGESADATACARLLAAAIGAPLDCLIVDHYALGARWESSLRGQARCVMAIDDLADRRHDCDLLLDTNFYDEPQGRYRGLVPPQCRLLLGPAYALLRPQFAEAQGGLRRQGRLVRDGQVARLLLFFGGGDDGGATLQALHGLASLGRAAPPCDVVVGAANPFRQQVAELAATVPGAVYHCAVDNMAALMAGADLALGAGGTATWERCALGLPALLCSIAANQRPGLQALARHGVVCDLGEAAALDRQSWARVLRKALAQPARLRALSQRSLQIMEAPAEPSETAAGTDIVWGAARVARVLTEVAARSTDEATG